MRCPFVLAGVFSDSRKFDGKPNSCFREVPMERDLLEEINGIFIRQESKFGASSGDGWFASLGGEMIRLSFTQQLR